MDSSIMSIIFCTPTRLLALGFLIFTSSQKTACIKKGITLLMMCSGDSQL